METENCYDKLLRATKENDCDTVRLLIEQGAYTKPTFRDRRKYGSYNPLHVAAKDGNLEILKILLTAKDADVNVTGGNLQTPLHNAIGYPEVTQFLIGKGATVNVQCCHGYTPLHFAVSNSKLESVKILVDNGASPYIASYPLCSSTPLDWANGEHNEGKFKNDEITQYMESNYKPKMNRKYSD